ncbi:protein kinase, partial [Cryobacterium frigoriphilum]
MTESAADRSRFRRVHPARNARVITGALSAMALMGMVAGFQLSASAQAADLAAAKPTGAGAPAVSAPARTLEAPATAVPAPATAVPAPAAAVPA